MRGGKKPPRGRGGGYEPAPGVLFVRDARGEGRGTASPPLEAGELRRARGRAELVGVRFHQGVARGRAGEPDRRARVLVRRHRVASGGGVRFPPTARGARGGFGAPRGACPSADEADDARGRVGVGHGPGRACGAPSGWAASARARATFNAPRRGEPRERGKKTSRVRRVEKCRERKRPPKPVSRSHHVCANSHEFFAQASMRRPKKRPSEVMR